MSNVDLYLEPFFKAFVVNVVLILMLIASFRGYGKKGRKNARHKYSKKVSRLGGVAIILSFLIALFWNDDLVMTSQISGIVVASVLIMIFGILDDYYELDWRIQLFFQVCVAVIIFIAGAQIEYITNPFGGLIYLNGSFLISLFVGILWIVLLMNSVNWLDGIDGLSGGVSLIAVIAIFFLALKPEVNQPPVGIITMILAGSFLSFLIFNFHPSRIMAGTSGSFFMGFILASLSIFAGTKIATTLLILSVTVLDAFWVIVQRFRSKRLIFESDERHLHYKLLKLGWSQKRVNVFYYGVTFLIAVVALNTREIGKAATILIVAALMMTVMIYVNRKLYVQNK